MKNLNYEIPKHRKKKQSSTSKSVTKSKHKHEYRQCLLIHSGKPYRAVVCKICGKIKYLYFFETENVEGRPYRRMLDDDEVYEKYKDLERYYIKEVWQKYVSVGENNANDEKGIFN